MTTNIIAGDNTKAYNKNFIEIDIENPNNVEVSKVIFVTGCINKSFKNPQFPIYVNFTSEETSKMPYINVGYLVSYDSHGRQETCDGSITFYVKNGVIYG